MAEAGSILGNSVVRLEDPVLVTGAGQYVDDLEAADAARVVFVRSSVAHGELRSVDVDEAKNMPGVLAVYHGRGDDLGIPAFQGFPMLPEVSHMIRIEVLGNDFRWRMLRSTGSSSAIGVP